MSAKALKFKKSAEPHPDPLKSLLHRIQKAYLPKDYLVFVGHIETLAQSDVGRRVQAEWQQAQASLQGNKQAALSNEILYRREGGKERDLLKRVSVIDNPLVFLLLLQNEQRRRRLAEYETKLRPEAGGRFIALLLNAMMKQDPIERLDLERQAQEGRMSEENECRRAKEQRKEAETKQRVEEHARRSYRGVLQTELPDPRPHLWSEPMTVTDYVESTGMGEDKVKAFLRTNKCQAIECSARNKRRRYGMETNFKVLNQWLCNWARHKRRPHPWDKRQRISREELDRRTHDVRLSWLAVTIHHCMTYACDRMCVSRSSGRTLLLGLNELTFSGPLSGGSIPSGKGQRRPAMLRQLDLGFRWEGFQKDGPNDFSVQVELSVSFEPRKYRFRCELAKLDKLLIYQDWLTEDQQTQVISAIAKGIYGQIQQRRSKNRQG